ncbi:alpha/beta fold hydrolase [Microbacterium rhizomatis]|uniref:Alpha/beta hydrolase n=1 Tax=Microbacterium rhizomatis TaxID=1631477 RepID=A0A5J5IY90_9MICO|nr:alpha/beta hydrolase [Microbacterium rhizomatis]KAA9106415.1 alpha/beta hydrolase [Microbacterium rhizomatis]
MTRTSRVRLRGLVLVAAVATAAALSACTAASPSRPLATPDADVAGRFDVGGGRMMYLECHGTGSPTIVLISGQRGSADDWKIVDPGVTSPSVWSLVGDHTRVCAYDRPGTPVGDAPSRSDPVPQPVTALEMADDLHALLGAAGIEGPVVIAAHSAGGLAGRLLASLHPDEVSGMVLVDALSDGLRTHMTPEQWAVQKPLLRGEIDSSIAEYPALEWISPDASFDELESAPPIHQMPLIVISADAPIGPTFPALKASGAIGADVPDDFGSVLDAAQARSQADQADLVEGAVHITETHSGHNVHHTQPALVAEAILDVVTEVRAGATTAAR